MSKQESVVKQFSSLYLAQSWCRRFHPDYVILQHDTASFAAGPADAIAGYERAGWVRVPQVAA